MEKREKLVVKSNSLIQQCRMSLTAPQQKMVAYICSTLDLSPDRRDYSIDLLDYFEVCGMVNSGSNYEDTKQVLEDLRNKSTWIRSGTKEILLGWLSGALIEQGNGTVQIEIDKYMLPYLVDLKKSFTKYELGYLLAMKSKYSMRIYELMKSYEYKHEVEFSPDDLQLMLISGYNRYNNFKQKVISVALDEINTLTDISLTVTEKKRGRKVIGLVFHIEKKSAAGRMLAHAVVNDLLS